MKPSILPVLVVLQVSGCDRPQSDRRTMTGSAAGAKPAPSVTATLPPESAQGDHSAESKQSFGPSPFDEALPLEERRTLLKSMEASDDPATLREMVVNIDVPFLEIGKQTPEELAISSNPYSVYPCTPALRKKGRRVAPLVLAELATPTESSSNWNPYKEIKTTLLVGTLASALGVKETQNVLNSLKDGPAKNKALAEFKRVRWE